jgi:hypothetical protein
MTPKGTTPYLDALRAEIQRRFGRSIRTKTDCQKLEDQIFEATGHLVSYNTLRRFFGLVPGGDPRSSVLDILSAHCGFVDFEAFKTDIGRFSYYFDWTQTVDKMQWTENERDSLFDRIRNEDFNAQSIFLWILYKVTTHEPISSWSFWLDHPMWTEGFLRKAQLVFFSNTLADEFRQRLSTAEACLELHQNPAAFRWVTHFFADYETIQHGYMANALDAMAQRIEVPLYYHGMRIMQHFLAGTWDSIVPHARAVLAEGFHTETYPILISRYFQARFWVYYLEHGGWDPQLTNDYVAVLASTPSPYHHLLGMEFLPVAAVLGFSAPVLRIMETQALHLDMRSTWSAAVDADLSRLAFMIALARNGDLTQYESHRAKLKPDFWYKAYRSYLQALYYSCSAIAGAPLPDFEPSIRLFPGLQRALTH